MEDKIEKLKWQIHAETSIAQITFWIIIMLLTSSFYVSALGIVFITGNVITTIRSVKWLGKNYFR